jgi:hypothetical protein
VGAAGLVRTAAALLSLGAASIHFSTAGEHGALFGAGFVAMGAFQATWAVLVLLKPTRLVLWAGLAGNGAIVALWFTSHTNGLPSSPRRAATSLRCAASAATPTTSACLP